ncbi:uncharacterized protein NPIL_302561 [Nephila pilipes]|uniref:Uncharacterized protein n=1 Tax=Nephila pilipes TaxID=299642 RepID=A0A8X6Q8L2_NEPPI|nr:uncharacterized protein NPIL_302561 [Nephila pilipes]
MVRVCPQPCSRLATAAIFIIAGVVQLLVGVILMRSKYANLLSGPDFMTATTNIGIGCIYGITASVWKINSNSMKNTARKNVLAALLTSVITVNTTTAIVLLMGDGNKLVTSYLENRKSETIDFAREVLAYAYVTSVFTPITCIVVSIVALSGRCFEICQQENMEKQEDSMMKEYSYNWVFDSKEGDLKVISDLVETPTVSSSSSISKGSMFSKKSSTDRRRSVLSLKNIPSPLNMWKQKREKILKDSALSRKQPVFDPSLQNLDFCSSSSEKLIPRIKQSSLMKKSNQKQDNLDKGKSLHFSDSNHSKMCKSILKRSSSGPDPRKMIFEDNGPSYSYNLGVPYSNEEVGRKRSVDLCKDKTGENSDYDLKNKRKKAPKHMKNNVPLSTCERTIDKYTKPNEQYSNLTEYRENDAYPVDPAMCELKAEALKELKQKIENILPGSSIAIIKLSDKSKEEIAPYFENRKDPRTASRKSSDSDVFQNEMDTDVSRGDVPDRPLFSEKSSSVLKPVSFSESSYPESAFKNKVIDPGISIIGKIRSKSLDFSHDELDLESSKCQNKDKSVNSWTSMKIVNDKSRNHPLSSTKTHSMKQKDRKCSVSRKMPSIAEIPFKEHVNNGYAHDPVFDTSDFDYNSQSLDENYNIKSKMSPSSRRIVSLKNARRKSSISSSNLLKRMWSSAASEPKMNVADLIVDEDSLIGLSEEELIERTLRIRSLRKTVEERLKKKVETEMQTNNFKECPVYL